MTDELQNEISHPSLEPETSGTMEIERRQGKDLNRFKCDCCKRILDIERKESFPCSSCGHGKMRPIEPKAFCCSCGKPIYDNADTDIPSIWKGTRSPIIETRGIDVTCPDCVFERLTTLKGVRDKEGELKQARESKGWSQQALGTYLDASQQFVAQMERGTRSLTEKALNFIEETRNKKIA
jgi:hypothetical protein